MIKAILGGRNAYKPDNLDVNLFGKFNGQLRYKFFCHMPEVKGSEIKPHWGRFKEFIVSKTDTTQFKGVDAVETTSYVRYFITSNNDNPVPIEPSDRRFQYIETEAEPRNRQYYNNLYDLLSNEEVLRCLYKYFNERDISNVDFTDDRIEGGAVAELKLQSVPLTTIFLQNLVDNPKLLDDKSRISVDNLWLEFVSFCSGANIQSKMSKISFSMYISKNAKRYGMEKKFYDIKGKATRGYTIDKDKLISELVKDGVIQADEVSELTKKRLLPEKEDEDSGVENNGKPPM
jgi:hypothetical protein